MQTVNIAPWTLGSVMVEILLNSARFRSRDKADLAISMSENLVPAAAE
jgi:hypothetical protein